MTRDYIILTILTLVLFTKNSNADNYQNGSKIPSHYASGHKKTIHKCCSFGEYVGEYNTCVRYNETQTLSEKEVYDENLQKTGKSIKDIFKILPGRFDDKSFQENVQEPMTLEIINFNIYIIENGILTLELPNMYVRFRYIANDDFCVDYNMPKKNEKAVLVWAIVPEDKRENSNEYFTYALLVSCFFMLLILIVYFLLPELRNLAGKILIAYVASLFLAFLLLAVIQIKMHVTAACIGLTFGIYYFFLASVCWMNVMSYDIWWTFRGFAEARPIHRRGERVKFLMYCLYAWGVPLAMTILLAILNTVDMRHLPWFITPNFPAQGCFLSGGVRLLYLYIPMLVLILCNCMFYLMTAFYIWRLSRGTAAVNTDAAGSPQAHRTNKQRFMVYLKLSVLMGLNWLLEIVSSLYPDLKMWYITDAYNVLIGLVIFLLFVCNRKTYRKFCIRYIGPEKETRVYPFYKTSSTTDSSRETTTLQLKALSNSRNSKNSRNSIRPIF